MPRIPNYVRLRGSESELVVDNKDMLGGFYEDAEVQTQQQQEGNDSDPHNAFSAAQSYQKSFHEQQHKNLEDVISKTSGFGRSLSHHNLNAYLESSGPMEGIKAVKHPTRLAKSGELRRLVSSRDSGNTPKLAISSSGKWQVQGGGGGHAHLERSVSGKWRPSENDQFIRTTSSPLGKHLASPNRQSAAGGKRTANSIQRVVSNPHREILQQKQHQPSRLSGSERDGSSPARRAWFAEDLNGKSSPPRRLQRQQTARFADWEKNGRASEGGEEDDEEEKPSPPRKLQRQQTGRFTNRQEKAISPQNGDHNQNTESTIAGLVPKSSSIKIVDSQRSFSLRETSRSRMDVESLLEEDAPRRKSISSAVKPRVSFSDVMSSRIPDRESGADAPRVQDSPSATAIRHQARLLSAATRSQPIRFNFEQPGFVERKSTDGCGSYRTGGGAQGSLHKEEKENKNPEPPLSRTFSTVSFPDKATYRRVTSAFTFSTPKNVQPTVVECVSCGKGLGIVVQGFSAGETSSFCKACKPAGVPGAVGGPGKWGNGEFYCPDKATNRTSSVKSFSKKKKNMLNYCRKLFGMT
ncbi:hypothetical protein R1flu_005746 [Riccia fluitans]|uniref:LIM zinc-binding domain-containing protein n=1 Tax=Riccia fluitans TaxID=41844 RepID=A0ABD1YY09_9MARC